MYRIANKWDYKGVPSILCKWDEEMRAYLYEGSVGSFPHSSGLKFLIRLGAVIRLRTPTQISCHRHLS